MLDALCCYLRVDVGGTLVVFLYHPLSCLSDPSPDIPVLCPELSTTANIQKITMLI